MSPQSAPHAPQPLGSEFTLGLMAKYWTVGQVKTRLGREIGLSAAAAVHRLFTLHLCRSLANSGDSRQICVAPDDQQPPFLAALKEVGLDQDLDQKWELSAQGGGDLGQRMSRWFSLQLRDPAAKAALIGADCPTLSPTRIEQAGTLLDSHDVVIGPAIDGGYYLIAIAGRWDHRFASLFDTIPWSTPEVLSITRDRIDQAGLSLALLEPAEDVDTIVELNRLRTWLSTQTKGDEASELAESLTAILPPSQAPSSQLPGDGGAAPDGETAQGAQPNE